MNLSTTYLGLKLRSPLVPSASPLSEGVDNLKQLEDAGASAIVLPSLFEEQVRQLSGTLHGSTIDEGDQREDSTTYFPSQDEFSCVPLRYLRRISEAKKAVKIPIIASLNCSNFGSWMSIAQTIERAGADALELNLYAIPTDPNQTSEDIEQGYLAILTSIKAQLKIPVAVKLSPYFTNLTRFAVRLAKAGADGLVLFNRFYQPDINLEKLTVVPTINLSTRADMRLPMRWISLLHGRLTSSLGATSGILNAKDAIKMLMVGADVTMLCSVLLRRGIGHLHFMEREMSNWLRQHGYDSVEQIKGIMSQQNCQDPSAFERAQFIRAVAVERTFEPAI